MTACGQILAVSALVEDATGHCVGLLDQPVGAIEFGGVLGVQAGADVDDIGLVLGVLDGADGAPLREHREGAREYVDDVRGLPLVEASAEGEGVEINGDVRAYPLRILD